MEAFDDKIAYAAHIDKLLKRYDDALTSTKLDAGKQVNRQRVTDITAISRHMDRR
jgi:hypothetical protein